jgi:Tol biopolymer transport system component
LLAPQIHNGAYLRDWGAFSAVPGVLAYQAGSSSPFENLADLVSVDRTGARSTVAASVYSQSRLSPDGTKLAFLRRDPRGTYFDPDIWIHDLARGTSIRLTFSGTTGMVWDPDGSRLVFAVRTNPDKLEPLMKAGIWRVPIDGGSPPELLFDQRNLFIVGVPNDWPPDGKQILFGPYGPLVGYPLFLMPSGGDHKPAILLQTKFVNWDARISPDSRWIAYVSNESGRDEVYVQSVPLSGAKYPISTSGGMGPRWSRDGKELFFVRADGALMSLPVTIGQRFTAGPAKLLLDSRMLQGMATSPGGTDFQPFPDGQRFLFALYRSENLSPPITVVLNWESEFEENKTRKQ